MSNAGSQSGRDPVEQLMESFLGQWRRGERPSLEEYAARCPDRADEIRELFPAFVELEQLKPVVQAGADSHVRPPPSPAPSAPSAAPHPERLGDYRILRMIGQGGMGVVYEAERQSLKCRVALKAMNPRFRSDETALRRFQIEASSAARLHHTNIVQVFDFGEEDGICYYAMQFIAGVALSEVLTEVRRLRAAAVAATAKATATDPESNGQSTEPAEGTLPAVTHGLMTGRYAAGPATAGEPDPAATVDISDGRTNQASFSAAGATPVPTAGSPDLARPSAIRSAGPGAARRNTDGSAGLSDTQQSLTAGPHPAADPRGTVDSASGSGSSSFAGQPHLVYFREIARIGAQVADALDYAHRQGIIHRDIKPSNILLDAQGNAWVTDFGLAKLGEGQDLSKSHDLIGTLRYMAPERFRGVNDRRGDIYALGATLYEMLALRPAFPERDQVQLIEQIVRQTAAPLRQLDRRIPRDLETIVHRVLSKEPKDRCENAADLRDELRRFLEGRPTRWRRVGPLEQFRRWCKRNPVLAAASILAAISTTLLAIGSTIAAWTYSNQVVALKYEQLSTKAAHQGLRNQLDRTQKAEYQARERLFESLVSQAKARRVSRRMGQRFETLNALSQAATLAKELTLPPERLDPLRDEAIACLALPDMKPVSRFIPSRPGESVGTFAFDATMSRYARRLSGEIHCVLRGENDEEIARFNDQGDRYVYVFALSPDGHYLAATHDPDHGLTVWDVDRRVAAVNVPGPVPWRSAVFSPNCQRIAVERAGEHVVVYNLATGQTLENWGSFVPGLAPSFRPDGTEIAVLYKEQRDCGCRILDADTGQIRRTFALPTVDRSIAWSPDGTTLAIAGDDRRIHLCDAATGIRKATLDGHIKGGLVSTFHPAGTLLASGGMEGRVWLWDTLLARPWLYVKGYAAANFSVDGRIVLYCEGSLTTYHVDSALEYRTLAHVFPQGAKYAKPVIRHDGRVLALGTNQGVVLWDIARGAELGLLTIGDAQPRLFDSSGNLITSGSSGVQHWPVVLDPDRGEFRIGPPRQLPLPAGPESCDVDLSGKIVAMAGSSCAFVATPKGPLDVGPLDDCRRVAVSPSGRWLATGSRGKDGVRVWSIRDQLQVAQPLTSGYGGVVFSPDGKWLMTTDPPCRLWAAGTWQETRQIGGEGLCFSPDGELLVVQDADGGLRLVASETGLGLARLESPDLCAVEEATFSPDRSRLVLVTNDGPAVHIWDLRAIRRQLAQIGLDWNAPAYSDDDPARATLAPLPPLKVEYGVSRLTGQLDPTAYEQLIGNFESTLLRHPNHSQIRERLASYCNDLAWELSTNRILQPDPQRALSLAERAVELAPSEASYLNTLGVAQYRAGRFAKAVGSLEKSLSLGKGRADAYDLFFLAMAHFQVGQANQAHADFDRAVEWRRDRGTLPPLWTSQLDSFQAEAQALLNQALPDLSADVFAPAPPGRR
jgi:serine/threonine protein kinase/WD40 repeat protein